MMVNDMPQRSAPITSEKVAPTDVLVGVELINVGLNYLTQVTALMQSGTATKEQFATLNATFHSERDRVQKIIDDMPDTPVVPAPEA